MSEIEKRVESDSENPEAGFDQLLEYIKSNQGGLDDKKVAEITEGVEYLYGMFVGDTEKGSDMDMSFVKNYIKKSPDWPEDTKSKIIDFFEDLDVSGQNGKTKKEIIWESKFVKK